MTLAPASLARIARHPLRAALAGAIGLQAAVNPPAMGRPRRLSDYTMAQIELRQILAVYCASFVAASVFLA